MAIIGFHHTAISTPDIERSVGFYRDCFGFEPVFDFSWQPGVELIDRMMGVRDTAARVVMLRTGNAFLEIFQFAHPAPKPQDPNRPVIDHGFTHICVVVDDAQAECARLERLGVRLHCPAIQTDLPLTGTYGRDPDGNVFEILEVRDPGHPLDFANRRLAALQAGAAPQSGGAHGARA
jgi:catechol 2,3-dioxygenase-like lactoylglutathione lyase family enzyme